MFILSDTDHEVFWMLGEMLGLSNMFIWQYTKLANIWSEKCLVDVGWNVGTVWHVHPTIHKTCQHLVWQIKCLVDVGWKVGTIWQGLRMVPTLMYCTIIVFDEWECNPNFMLWVGCPVAAMYCYDSSKETKMAPSHDVFAGGMSRSENWFKVMTFSWRADMWHMCFAHVLRFAISSLGSLGSCG